MIFNNSHVWLYKCHKAMTQPHSKLYFGDFMLASSDLEYMMVLMEDGLVVFNDGLYELTEAGHDIITMIDSYKEL